MKLRIPIDKEEITSYILDSNVVIQGTSMYACLLANLAKLIIILINF